VSFRSSTLWFTVLVLVASVVLVGCGGDDARTEGATPTATSETGSPPRGSSPANCGERATGTVKWFDEPKGYGFITPDDGSDDVFAHHSEINIYGFKSLREGQRVSYDVSCGENGNRAVNIENA
jgi:CspA family cold shock protein